MYTIHINTSEQKTELSMFVKKVSINQYGTCVLPTHEYTFVIESRKGNLCLKVYHCSKSTMIMIFIKILKSVAVCIIFPCLPESKCHSNA